MIQEDPLPLKTVFAWCFVILSGLIAAYIAFLSLISVWVGVTHIYRAGSWVPILVGIILLCVVLWLYFRLSRTILNLSNRKEEGIIESLTI
jgi:hypothetical protein